jgi:hypothetical protein
MISPAEASADGAEMIRVRPGDQVPGHGTVREITQRGTEWIIVTDRGAIQ